MRVIIEDVFAIISGLAAPGPRRLAELPAWPKISGQFNA